MSVLLNAINDNVEAIEDELRFYVCDKLNNDSLDVSTYFSIQEGFTNGWSDVTVFSICISIYNDEEELLREFIEISDLDDFESEVEKILELVE